VIQTNATFLGPKRIKTLKNDNMVPHYSLAGTARINPTGVKMVFKLRTHSQISNVAGMAANSTSFPRDKPGKSSTRSAHKMCGIKSLFLAGHRTGSLLLIHRHG
jgi:hypothetical protein